MTLRERIQAEITRRLQSAPIAGALVNAGLVGGALYLANQYQQTSIRNRLAQQFQEPLQFPLNLTQGEGGKYFMSLRFVKYVKTAISEQKFIDDQGNILLPIPNNLKETTSLKYSTEELGSVLGSAVEAIRTPNGAANVLESGLAAAARQASLKEIATNLDLQRNSLINAVDVISGTAVNPFLTTTFKNPEFKTHNFSWKLIPKNEDESEIIKKIIHSMKYHILPGLKTTSGTIFEYPEMLLVKLYPNDEYTYKFKPCVVKSLDINYTPSGAPSFYFGPKGAPLGVEISISLQEIEYFTKYDYDDRTGIFPVPTPRPNQMEDF